MSDRVTEINKILEVIPDVEIIKSFEQSELSINGRISVFVEGLTKSLEFDVQINPQYPFKSHNSETIKFYNCDLMQYKHIMSDGSICIYTAHSPIISQKLNYDIESVKAWIKKYYIDNESDTHYEHLIVPHTPINGTHFAYFFNEIDFRFYKNQYGYVEYSSISNGSFYSENIQSNIIQNFKDKNGKKIIEMKWNAFLKSLTKNLGLFIFLEDCPTKNQRWVFEKWEEFSILLPNYFLKFLNDFEKIKIKENVKIVPLLIGYNISNEEIHWQTIILEIGKFPIFSPDGNKKWYKELICDSGIVWAMTKNCSSKYFFGRGHLSNKIIQSKILIIGIGAIGSIIAKTLVRSGCTNVDFLDYDIKEPENVCRSEYSFASGINNKTNDLLTELFLISPFFESTISEHFFSEAFDFYIKSHFGDKESKFKLEEHLNKYDIIFDCTSDNDLLYVLNKINISSILLNISISNHAKHLVCTSEQNRYEFITTQFDGNVLKFDIDDLHNPTGCWNPTFKASYNDINTLVQYAIKHINLKFEQDRRLRNFVLETEETHGFNIKLKEF